MYLSMKKETIEKALECLELVGVPYQYDEEDFDIKSLDLDSIQYISYIVELESCFEIEFPDEFLSGKLTTSFYALIYVIEELQKDKKM